LIFINLAAEPFDFEPIAADIVPYLTPHELENAKICQTRHYEVHANWKLIDENARECYHCPGSHPEYCHAVISAAAVNSRSKAVEHEIIKKNREAHWKSLGLETASKPFRPESWHSVARYALQPGVVSESLDGQPVAPLMGVFAERDMGVLGIGIYPNFLFQASSDHAVSLRFTPFAATLTKVQINWMVHRGAVEGVDYEVKNVEAVWKATAEQH
jgi:Rieske 2Fe-2S family protein